MQKNPTPRGARHGYIEPLGQSREMQFSISEAAPKHASQNFPASVCATYPRRREWQASNSGWRERKKLIMLWRVDLRKLDAKKFYYYTMARRHWLCRRAG